MPDHRESHQGPSASASSSSLTFVNSNASVSGRDYSVNKSQSGPTSQMPNGPGSTQIKSFAAAAKSGINYNPIVPERKPVSKPVENHISEPVEIPNSNPGKRGRGDGVESATSGNDESISPKVANFLAGAIGSEVTVSLTDGRVFESGYLHSFSSKGDIMISNPSERVLNGTQSPTLEFLGVERSGIVDVTFKDVNSSSKPHHPVGRQRSSNSDRDLPTDKDLSGRSGPSGPKTLVPWRSEEPEQHVALGGPHHSGGWGVDDMFQANAALAAQNPGWKKSTFDPNLSQYTVPIDRRDTEEFKNLERDASRIAAEIEGQAKSREYADKENAEDEEEAFSAVVRKQDHRSQDARVSGGGGNRGNAGGYNNNYRGGGNNRYQDRGGYQDNRRDNNYGRQPSRENINSTWRRDAGEPVANISTSNAPSSQPVQNTPSPVPAPQPVAQQPQLPVRNTPPPPAKVASPQPQPAPQNVQSFNSGQSVNSGRNVRNDREPDNRNQRPAPRTQKSLDNTEQQNRPSFQTQSYQKRDKEPSHPSQLPPSTDGRVFTPTQPPQNQNTRPQSGVWNNRAHQNQSNSNYRPNLQQPARAGNYQQTTSGGAASSGNSPTPGAVQRQASKSTEPTENSQPAAEKNEKQMRTSPVRSIAGSTKSAGSSKQLNPDAAEFKPSFAVKPANDSPSPSNFSEASSTEGPYHNQNYMQHPQQLPLPMQFMVPVTSMQQGMPMLPFRPDAMFAYPQMYANQFPGMQMPNANPQQQQQQQPQNFQHMQNMQQANPAQIVANFPHYPMMQPPRASVMISSSPPFIQPSGPGQMDNNGQVYGQGYQQLPYQFSPYGQILYPSSVPPGGPYQSPGGPGFLNMAGNGQVPQFQMMANGLPMMMPFMQQQQQNMMQQQPPVQMPHPQNQGMQGRMQHSPHHPN